MVNYLKELISKLVLQKIDTQNCRKLLSRFGKAKSSATYFNLFWPRIWKNMNSISSTLFVFWLEQHPKDFKLSNRIGCLLKMGNFLSEVTGVSVNTGGTTWLPVHRLHFTLYCFMNLTMLLTDQKMKQMSIHTISLLYT